MRYFFFLAVSVGFVSRCNAQEIPLYSLSFENFRTDEHQGASEYLPIVSLGDGYSYSIEMETQDYESDTLIIAPEHIGYFEEGDNKNLDDRHYHILTPERRQTMLAKSEISEQDTIYVYAVGASEVLKFPVSEMKIVAFLNIYWHESPAWSFEYVVGFQLDGLDELENREYWGGLVYVGTENPFEPKNLIRLDFKELALEEKLKLEAKLDSIPLQAARIQRIDSLVYLAFGLNPQNEYATISRLLVFDEHISEIVYDESFRDSESRYPTQYGTQFTGSILKNRPPVIMGFYDYTFGCPSINFLGKDQEPIWIRCDNRH